MLTDAPAPELRSAVVTIDSIYFQGEGARTVLRSSPVTTDLLTLSDDVAAVVDNVSVPPGTYGQLRFVIASAYIELIDGSIYATKRAEPPAAVTDELKTPSWDTSGFKVTMPEGGVTIEGDQKVLLVDFDVGESFGQEAGGAWVMRPVLRASDFVATGSIAVVANVQNVSLAAPLQIELLDAAGTREGLHEVTDDDGDGDVETEFAYLDPRQGPFTVSLPGAVTDPATPLPVALGSGEAARLDLTVVSVTPPSGN